jgi:hypothetical protein
VQHFPILYPKILIQTGSNNKVGRWVYLKKEKKEEKEENLLKELCGDDARLYDVLARKLYLDPSAAISEKDLEILIEEAEKSIKDRDYEEAAWKHKLVLDKALFEATQNPGERDRYINVIQDLLSKAVHANEKAKEKVEKEGRMDRATSVGRSIENYKFMSERIEDVTNVASQFYNERLVIRGEKDRREVRREKMRKMGSEERIEAEREETRIEEREKGSREARREERREKRIT